MKKVDKLVNFAREVIKATDDENHKRDLACYIGFFERNGFLSSNYEKRIKKLRPLYQDLYLSVDKLYAQVNSVPKTKKKRKGTRSYNNSSWLDLKHLKTVEHLI